MLTSLSLFLGLEKMKKSSIIMLLAVSLLLFLPLFLPSSVSSENKAGKVDIKIAAQLEKEEKVNVLIFMNENSKRIKLSSAISTLSSEGFEIERKSNYFPIISGKITKETFEKLKNNPNIESIMLEPEIKPFVSISAGIINATNTWSLQISGINLTGQGETVCIIDTGVNYSNPNLGGCFGDGCRVMGGYDFVNNDSDPIDDDWHGTFVAGIVASKGEITGIAPDSKIVALKACDTGACYSVAITDSLKWCVDNSEVYNISVISMSLGSSTLYTNYCDSESYYSLWTALINNATAKNITVVAASGNDGSTTAIASPACIQNVTSVGMTYRVNGGEYNWWTCVDSSRAIDQVVCLSNRNNITDIFAPGSPITSIGFSSSCCSQVNGGTSFATPQVSAAAAILQQYSRLQRNRDLSAAEINSLLKDHGKQIYDPATDLNFSRLDIYASISSMDSSLPPSLALISPSNNLFYNSMNITFSCNASDKAILAGNANLANITLYVWNSTGIYSSTTNSVSNAFNQTQFNITMQDGNYTWNCLATDAAGNTAWADSNFTLTITTPLRIYLISPSNDAVSNSLNHSLRCNATANLNLTNITLYAWNSTGIYNSISSSIIGTFNEIQLNLTDMPEGSYNWNCLASDSANNTAWADSNFTLTIDTTIPDASLSIEPNPIYTGDETKIICSSSEMNLSTIKIYVDAILRKVCAYSLCDYAFSSTLTGTKNVGCIVDDKASNSNSAAGTITVNQRSVERGVVSRASTITTATAIETVTKEIAEPKIETIDVSIAQTPVTETGLEAKTTLISAIEKVLEKTLNENAISSLETSSSAITADSKVSRSIKSENGKSNLNLKIKYDGAANVKNFIIHDRIPKSFASDANSITVSAPGAQIEIVEQDPEYLFIYPEILPQQEISISYAIDKEVDENVLNEASAVLFAESITEEKGTAGINEMVTTAILFIAVLAMAIITVYLKRK